MNGIISAVFPLSQDIVMAGSTAVKNHRCAPLKKHNQIEKNKNSKKGGK